MFGCPKQAWHDAFAGIQSKNGGGGGHFGWEVVQGELAKIKSAVQRLPKSQQDVGMLMYAPESAVTSAMEQRVIQMLWREALTRNPQWLKSYKTTCRLQLLIPNTIKNARLQEIGSGDRCISHSQVARAIGLTHSNFKRDFEEEYELLVDQLRVRANAGLLVIDDTCRNIRERYREVA
jgi:hypothetical protein